MSKPKSAKETQAEFLGKIKDMERKQIEYEKRIEFLERRLEYMAKWLETSLIFLVNLSHN